MTKKEWLDYLYYFVNKQQDFALCGLYKLSNGEVRATKWASYHKAVFPVDINEGWKLNKINQRQILACEVVLDLESREGIGEIIQTLEKLKIEHYVYDTGSRGFHVSLFFSRDLIQKEKEKVISIFDADLQKSFDRTMIALEYVPHWKSQKIKEIYNGN